MWPALYSTPGTLAYMETCFHYKQVFAIRVTQPLLKPTLRWTEMPGTSMIAGIWWHSPSSMVSYASLMRSWPSRTWMRLPSTRTLSCIWSRRSSRGSTSSAGGRSSQAGEARTTAVTSSSCFLLVRVYFVLGFVVYDDNTDQLWYGVRLLAEKQATNFGDGEALVSFTRDSIGEYHREGKVCFCTCFCTYLHFTVPRSSTDVVVCGGFFSRRVFSARRLPLILSGTSWSTTKVGIYRVCK